MSEGVTVHGQQSTVHGQQSTVHGLILLGGKSSRMGFDKGTIDYHGKPQREYLFDLLQKFCPKVFTSCKSSAEIPTHLNPIADAFEMESPLNGILSAFKSNPDVSWLTVPVDMPSIDEASIQYLMRHRKPEKMATCFYDSEGKNPEPLFTLWESHAFEALMDFYASGKISPRTFLLQSDIHVRIAPDKSIHQNINSPEELKAFRNGPPATPHKE
jgi:molybdenum cofactor guanylyltransferase